MRLSHLSKITIILRSVISFVIYIHDFLSMLFLLLIFLLSKIYLEKNLTIGLIVFNKFQKIEDKLIFNDLSLTSTLVENSNKVFFSERHVENTNWFIKDSLKLKTPVTSFYSFKGGVGRTTATILVALLLARQGKKVLLIDFDLEAPGLASVFVNPEDNTENLLGVKGFVDFLIDYEANKREITKLNIDDYYFVRNEQILVGSNGGELIIVPAIATDTSSAESYIDKLSKTNIKYGFGKDYTPDFFLKTLENKINPDYILIDKNGNK